MPVELHYRYFGGEGNPPLVILHGLLGSSRNWQTLARDLAAHHEVFALDLRNHGDSPHDHLMDFEVMAEDLRAWLDRRAIAKVNLLGHSLGGKLAMRFACESPERVDSLAVVDIAPKSYEPHHRAEFQAMNTLPLATLESRQEAEDHLARDVSDWAMRKFLLTNLERQPDAGFYWKINLPVLTEKLPFLAADSLEPRHRFEGPTLFMRGDRSSFVLDEDAAKMERHFPNYILTTVAGSGHNIHFDNREAFLRGLAFFRDRLRNP